MKKLTIGNVTYEFNPNDSYKEHEFISIKKITSFKDNQKYQSITIKKGNWDEVREWLIDVLKEEEEVPF